MTAPHRPAMPHRTLGRTGLRVSLLSLGTGGPSLLGQRSGVGEDDVARLIHRALDLGVNFIDTSAVYQDSEAILGRALRGVPSDRYVLATKFMPARGDRIASPRQVEDSIEQSLRRLQVQSIDVMQFHGVKPEHYEPALDCHLATVQKLQKQGKFRFLGITERLTVDHRHEVLSRALTDDLFDTIMVAYNLMSPTPEHAIFPMAQKRDVGVIVMIPVRRALSRPQYLHSQIADAKARGFIARDALPDERPLDWLVKDHVPSLPAAGYKFAAAHPAVATVLSGTANIAHLEENAEAIAGPSLPKADVDRIRGVFGNVWEPLAD